MEYFWWEKTVEYAFVHEHVQTNVSVAPLGGIQEKGGDVILGENEKWVLIEFKRKRDELNSEQSKFDDGKFVEAKKSLKNRSMHHLLVYGELNVDKLVLKGQFYFGTKEFGVEKLLKRGTDEETFLSYFQEFISYKKSKQNSSGGGITSVVGVDSEGKVSKIMSAHEYEKTLVLKKELNEELNSRIELKEKEKKRKRNTLRR